MIQPRPRVFIGSSTEGLHIAKAIQQNLAYECEVTIWSQGVFGLSEGTLESLVNHLEGFDFAVLVLTPDDVTHSRGDIEQSPRDNVLLELGLFIGALGRERSFIVYDRSANIKLPSDLAGVTPATFQPHSDGNWQASLGEATTRIEDTIRCLGRHHRKTSVTIDENTHFQVIHDLLDMDDKQFIIWMYENNQSLRRDPSSLLDSDYRFACMTQEGLASAGPYSVGNLCDKLPDAGLLEGKLRNNKVALTDRGKKFAEWLISNGYKATWFHSNLGGWGPKPENEYFLRLRSSFVDHPENTRA